MLPIFAATLDILFTLIRCRHAFVMLITIADATPAAYATRH